MKKPESLHEDTVGYFVEQMMLAVRHQQIAASILAEIGQALGRDMELVRKRIPKGDGEDAQA